MTDKQLMQMALDCLLAWEEESSGYGWSISDKECVEALRARLAQPAQDWPTPSEQYAFERGFQRAREITFELWQWLTDEEIGEIIEASQITLKNYCSEEKQTEFARAIEAKLRRKNEQLCLF